MSIMEECCMLHIGKGGTKMSTLYIKIFLFLVGGVGIFGTMKLSIVLLPVIESSDFKELRKTILNTLHILQVVIGILMLATLILIKA
jgi:hypothetical protein